MYQKVYSLATSSHFKHTDQYKSFNKDLSNLDSDRLELNNRLIYQSPSARNIPKKDKNFNNCRQQTQKMISPQLIHKVSQQNFRLVTQRLALFKKNCQLVNQINELRKSKQSNLNVGYKYNIDNLKNIEDSIILNNMKSPKNDNLILMPVCKFTKRLSEQISSIENYQNPQSDELNFSKKSINSKLFPKSISQRSSYPIRSGSSLTKFYQKDNLTQQTKQNQIKDNEQKSHNKKCECQIYKSDNLNQNQACIKSTVSLLSNQYLNTNILILKVCESCKKNSQNHQQKGQYSYLKEQQTKQTCLSNKASSQYKKNDLTNSIKIYNVEQRMGQNPQWQQRIRNLESKINKIRNQNYQLKIQTQY